MTAPSAFTCLDPRAKEQLPALTSLSLRSVFLVAAGKHVPASQMGNGGDAYAWQLTF